MHICFNGFGEVDLVWVGNFLYFVPLIWRLTCYWRGLTADAADLKDASRTIGLEHKIPPSRPMTFAWDGGAYPHAKPRL